MLIKSEDTIELNKAILAAQSKFPMIGKTKENDFYRKNGRGSKYAAYDDVYAGVKPILCDAGLIVEHEHKMEYKEVEALVIVKQTVLETGETSESTGGKQIESVVEVVVSTSIIHAATGQYITITSSTFPDKTSMHGTMAAVTYLKRYNLTSILDIAVCDDDDDGNGGLNSPEERYNKTVAMANYATTGKKAVPPKQTPPKQEPKNMSAVTQQDLQSQPGDLPFEKDPPPTNGTTEAAPDRPMTDTERKRLGKVDKDQVESLKAILEKKGINKDKWKSWLFAEYSFNSITDITDDVYDEISQVVAKTPNLIMTPGASTK